MCFKSDLAAAATFDLAGRLNTELKNKLTRVLRRNEHFEFILHSARIGIERLVGGRKHGSSDSKCDARMILFEQLCKLQSKFKNAM